MRAIFPWAQRRLIRDEVVSSYAQVGSGAE